MYSLGGFAGAIALSVFGVPAGVTAAVTPSATGGTLTLSVGATARPGRYVLAVTGVSGSLTRQVSITLTVPAPDFTLTADTAALTLAQGASGAVHLTVTPNNGFVGAVHLTVTGDAGILGSPGDPTKITASFDFATVNLDGTNTATSTLTLAVGTQVPPGTYSLQITGTDNSGTRVHSVPVNVTVTAPPTLSLSLAQFATRAGDADSGTITLTGAPANAKVNLTSSDPAVIVPPFVIVPSGDNGVEFSITCTTIESSQVTIIASYGGIIQTAQLNTHPAIELTAVATSANKVTLYWTAIDGAIGYNIYRSTAATGPYTQLNLAAITTMDTGPGVTDKLMYSDADSLVTGTEYFYYIAAINPDKTPGAESNTDSATPNATTIPWDSGNAAQIVSQVNSIVLNNLEGDETDVGRLSIGGPDGVIYQGYTDGTPPQAFAAPGYYNDTSHTLVYNDGSEIPAPNDPPTLLNESVTQPGLIRSSPAYSANVYPQQTQVFNKQYNPTVRYAGILREVQTQPGFPSMMSYLGLPSALNDGGFFQTNVDGRNGKTGTGTSVFPSRDTGYTYTGGTAYTPKVNRKTGTTNYIRGELDAGLMLYRSSDPTHPGWQPYATPVGADWQSEVLGEPLENDAAAASKGSNSRAHVFITGEPLMAFKAPGYGTIPDNLVVLSFHALGSGRVFTFDPKTSITKNVGDATFVKFEKDWLRRSSVVLKRMNTIAQVLTPQTSVIPNGPGNSFYKSGAYIRGASWGDLVDPFGEIDGVMLFPGGPWTDDPGITWQEGAYPGPGSRYVTYIEQNPFFWETYINLDTNP